MKVVAIHQPHYFPWLGYLDKMAKADEFVVLDEVQLTDGSPMVRNRFLQLDGQVKFLSVDIAKQGYLERKTNEIALSNWRRTSKKHRGFLECNYGKAPWFGEIMERAALLYEKDYERLVDLDLDTVSILKEMFGIETPIVMQSELEYDRKSKNNDLVLELCKLTDADVYLSGRGAKSYMDVEAFRVADVKVVYQEFACPVYPQYRQDAFAPNLSALDLLFQCGIDGARKIFYGNMRSEAV